MMRLLALLPLAAALIAGCVTLTPAERKEMRALRRDSAAEADAARAALDATDRADALLTVARLQDGRQGQDELIRLSRHPDPAVRAAAARALGLVAEQGVADVLVHLLEDPDGRVVAQAAFALSQVEYFLAAPAERAATRAAVEAALLVELDDCRREMRWGDSGRLEICRVVVRSLGAMGGEAANDALWDALSKAVGPPSLQRAVPVALAVQARAGRGSPITAEQLTFLAPLMLQADHPAQWAGAYLLARGDVAEDAADQAGALLTLSWERAGGDTARVWTVQALGRVGRGGEDIIAGALQSPQARVQIAAIRAAGARGLGDALLAALQTAGDDLVRAELLQALARVEPPPDGVWTWVTGALPDLGPPATAALAGLAPTAPDDVVQALVALLSSPEGPVRRAAAGALSGVEAAEEPLIAALAVEPERAGRIDLAAALAERPTPTVEGLLMGLVGDPDPIVGAIAAEGLGPRPGGHVAAKLAEAYAAANAAGDEERRLAIVRALLPREDAPVDLARAALNDADPLVRDATWKLVLERFDRSTLDALRPPARPLPDLADPRHGVGDVTGATIQTTRGAIELELHPWLAPGAVASWVALAEAGYFDGILFHRVVPDFVVQAGDPIGNGWGGPGHTIRCEYSAEPYRRGTLGMALSGKDTGGSQWFITLAPQPHLDGRYTVFGQTVGDDAVLDAIRVGDRIDGIEVHRQDPVPTPEKNPPPTE